MSIRPVGLVKLCELSLSLVIFILTNPGISKLCRLHFSNVGLRWRYVIIFDPSLVVIFLFNSVRYGLGGKAQLL